MIFMYLIVFQPEHKDMSFLMVNDELLMINSGYTALNITKMPFKTLEAHHSSSVVRKTEWERGKN